MIKHKKILPWLVMLIIIPFCVSECGDYFRKKEEVKLKMHRINNEVL